VGPAPERPRARSCTSRRPAAVDRRSLSWRRALPRSSTPLLKEYIPKEEWSSAGPAPHDPDLARPRSPLQAFAMLRSPLPFAIASVLLIHAASCGGQTAREGDAGAAATTSGGSSGSAQGSSGSSGNTASSTSSTSSSGAATSSSGGSSGSSSGS